MNQLLTLGSFGTVDVVVVVVVVVVDVPPALMLVPGAVADAEFDFFKFDAAAAWCCN